MAKKKSSPKSPKRKRNDWRSLIVYFVVVFAALSLLSTFLNPGPVPDEMDYSTFLSNLDGAQIQSVTVHPNQRMIEGTLKSGTAFKTNFLDYPGLITDLRDNNVTMTVSSEQSEWVWGLVLQALFPFIMIGLLWFFIFRPAQGANNQAMSFGKSRAKTFDKDKAVGVTFKNVAGVDEAMVELKEIVDYLKSPKKYQAIGAKIPKGVLLMGPPGTGKTLLAKAIAGESNVPFFSLSGSDFVEMFVGVGASRVRDLFAQAKKTQPAIIFLDEIDAVGRQRGAGVGGGHDEREQTLNQLLVEMDGFNDKQTVIIIAATNRPDILDPALLRPGRFDRQIVVDKPDIKGREQILEIHAKKKKFARDIKLDIIAKRTPGFTGADLANLLNEAALLSARRNRKTIGMDEVEESVDRVMAGPQRKSRVMSQKEKEMVAYHEVGHALVAHFLPNTDPVHKISILPRGMALGYTLQLPIEDKMLISKTEMEDKIKILMGGRIAEDQIFNEITSGASNDIERATDLARNYVCNYGMSEKLGARKYGKSQSQVFLGRDYADHTKDYSEQTATEIDQEIHAIIDRCYKEAETLLKKHNKDLVRISKDLLEKEVLEAGEFKAYFEEPETT